MPVHFLSEAEHESLNRFPSEMACEELERFFLLCDEDYQIIQTLRGKANQLGFAVQLGCLRYLGFFPEPLQSIPTSVTDYVAHQLELSSEVFAGYGQRSSTQRNHQRQIQTLLGYRRALPIDLLALEQWLLKRALEHDKPLLLFQFACNWLRQHQLVRLGTTRLEKLVATARNQAQETTYQNLQSLLTPERLKFLDGLLKVDEELGRTRLSWLQRTPTGNNPKQILETLDKIQFLQRKSVDQWDLSQLSPNRVNYLAKVGARATNQSLQRSSEVRRYPLLSAFLKQSLYNFSDALIEMVNQRLWELHREAKRTFEIERLKATESINDKLKTLQNLGEILLDDSIEPQTVRATVFESIKPKELRSTLEEAKQLIRPEEDAYVDYFCRSYRRVRCFSTQFLATLTFAARGDDQGLLRALVLVHEIHQGKRRKLPDDAPTDFVLKTWKAYIRDETGAFNWRHYELAALWVLRQQLRSGDIHLPNVSRRFCKFSTYLMPKADWQENQGDLAQLTGTPLDGKLRLRQREEELRHLMAQVEALLNTTGSDLREEKDKLVLTPLEAEERALELKQLTHTVGERLPALDITDLLIEVDNWTHFSEPLEHLHSPQTRDPSLLQHLYACLLAQACNLDLKQMAVSTGLSYRRLLWCNTWYIRDETLREANNCLVNYHFHLPLSQLWGNGMLSSSDGQRFPAKGSIREARALPPYFGYGKGITFYSWTSDQCSQYGSKPIPSTVRDSSYVLDEILDNETELPILEHTTDTAGYTELIFALFDLLGLQFSPRIRDLGDQKLYRTANIKPKPFPKLKPYLEDTTPTARFLADWDEIMRLVGSLKTGWVTASLIIQKLQAFPRKHPLLRALQEYGRLIKTIHILRWYCDQAHRRRLNRQLNKGEALHSLRTHLFFANQGQLRTQQDEQLNNQVGCLNLVTNAIIVWNTVYLQHVFQQLEQEGQPVSDDDAQHIWPTRHAHINVYGKYSFNTTAIRQQQSLRPLRQRHFQP